MLFIYISVICMFPINGLLTFLSYDYRMRRDERWFQLESDSLSIGWFAPVVI